MASDGQSILSRLQCFDHLGERIDVVTEVGIHRSERDRLMAGDVPAVNHGAGQAELSAAMEAANRQISRELLDDGAGPVGRVVVDDDDLAVQAVCVKYRT
jgi:hypothetical protein